MSGIDVNEDMLSAARRICPDVAWHHGDASELPFDDLSFDAVVSQFVLMFVPDRVATLKEMWRVLSPAGSLAVAVWWQSPAYPLLAEMARDRIGEEMATAVMDSFCLEDGDALLELFRSAGIATASTPSAETSFAVASSASAVRAVSARLTPFSAKARAMYGPRPLDAPVSSACFPRRSMVSDVASCG